MSARTLVIGSGWSARTAPHAAMPALWLASRGHEVEYVGFGSSDGGRIVTPIAALPAAMASGGPLLRHFRLAFLILRRRLSRQSPAHYLILGSPATLAARVALVGVPPRRITYLTQDYLEPGRHPFWRWCEHRIARRAAAVVSNEPHRARFLASDYRLPRVPLVVRTAFPSSWPLPEAPLSLRDELLAGVPAGRRASAVLIMAGGPFTPTRCGEQAIAALASLPADYRLVFTASAPEDRAWSLAQSCAAAAGVADRVLHLPRLDHARFLEVMACCDVGLLLYRNDGIGNFCQCPGRLSEYALCGLPAVASDFPSLALPLLRWDLGSVCDPGSPASIAAAILTVTRRNGSGREAERARLQRIARSELAYDAGGRALEAIVAGTR